MKTFLDIPVSLVKKHTSGYKLNSMFTNLVHNTFLNSVVNDCRYTTDPFLLSVNGFIIWALVSISRSNVTFFFCVFIY